MNDKDPDFRATIWVLIFSSVVFFLSFFALQTWGSQYMHDISRIKREMKGKKGEEAAPKKESAAKQWLKGVKTPS